MRFKRHIELEKAQLNITPLIDVVLQLMIFFMLTSSFVSHEGIKVNLPSAASGQSLPQQDLVIVVTAEDKILVNNKNVGIEKLNSRIKQAAKDKAKVAIRADKEASLGRVVEIWDLCRDAGLANIDIATIHRAK